MTLLDISERHALLSVVDRDGSKPVAERIDCSVATLGRALAGGTILDLTARSIRRLLAIEARRLAAEAGSK